MTLDPNMPVLVVDDYSIMVRIIHDLLRQLGFVDVDDAADGAAALEKMNTKRYGLVISDWNMEPMTGFDLLRRVRANPDIETTPFIMVTTESKTENDRGEEYGEVRLLTMLHANTAVPPSTLLSAIMLDLDRFVGTAPQHDDVTLMLLRAIDSSVEMTPITAIQRASTGMSAGRHDSPVSRDQCVAGREDRAESARRPGLDHGDRLARQGPGALDQGPCVRRGQLAERV